MDYAFGRRLIEPLGCGTIFSVTRGGVSAFNRRKNFLDLRLQRRFDRTISRTSLEALT